MRVLAQNDQKMTAFLANAILATVFTKRSVPIWKGSEIFTFPKWQTPYWLSFFRNAACLYGKGQEWFRPPSALPGGGGWVCDVTKDPALHRAEAQKRAFGAQPATLADIGGGPVGPPGFDLRHPSCGPT